MWFRMAAVQRSYGLLDLPPEIKLIVLSYLSDIDLINVRNAIAEFEDTFQRLICREGRELNFSRCYHLREEDLIQVLKLGRDYITSININHCYWLTPNCLKLIMKLPNLQELHMIDCGPLSLPLKEIFPLGLSALSFSYDVTWRRFLYGKLDFGYKYQHKLFGYLKQLTVHIEDGESNGLAHCIADVVLQYCLQLETLTLYESGHSSHLESRYTIDYPDGLLPKLTKLHLHLNTCSTSINGVLNWIKDIFRQRKTLLTEVCLGKSSYILLEFDPELALPCINAEELSNLCLFSSDRSRPELPAIPKIWMDRRTKKCKVVSLQGLTLEWMSDTSKLVAELGPQLQELNLKNCAVDISDLLMGLTTIAQHCTQLTKLDLTLHSSDLTNDDSIDDLFINISQFKALKVLYMSVGLLSRSRNLPSPKTVPGQQKSRIGSQTEISMESMRSSHMWRLTQSCVEVEYFRLTNERDVDNRVVCESALACISNWKKLKELHLVNITTLGEGSFLPFITKNCPQLTTLYLANVCCEGMCNYTTSLIESLSHATDLKDLSIIQNMELSSMLSKALINCLGLERMYFKSLVIKQKERDGFIKLIELPKLVCVWVEAKSTTTPVIKSIKMMFESLKSARPSLTYYIENKLLRPHGSRLPLAHQELTRYDTGY